MASTSFNLMNVRDQEKVRKLLEIPDDVEHESEENYEVSDDSTDEEDYVSGEDLNTETEQSSSSDEENFENCSVPVYIGRDKSTKWNKNKPAQNVRTRSHNIITHLPGPKGAARNAATPLDAWNLFLTEDILDKVVTYTNMYIDKIKDNFSLERHTKHTTTTEIKAVIGLLYLAGTYRSGRQNLEDLWATDGTGVEMFRTVMSLFRFKFILRCLRFDDKETRQDRKLQDKLAPIREVFESFLKNCKDSYTISEYGTVDEKLEPFRGRCGFRQYIPSKPAKYGIKIFALVDARTFYTNNMEVYVGTQPEGPYKISNKPEDVVVRLCEPIVGTGRNVTMDNWFTSYPLSQKLLTHKLTMVGTVRKNKREIPQEFLNTKRKEIKSSMFGFQEKCTLVSYIPKKGKNVLLLSTMHNNDKIDQATGDARKPEIITFYNLTKGGVDVVDKMCASYSCARSTRRWPMVVFYSMLNVAAINGFIIFLSNTSGNMNRRQFMKKISIELVMNQLQYRASASCLPKEVKNSARKLTNTTPPTEKPVAGKRARCAKCTKKDRKTQYYCVKCYTFLCMEHAKIVCEDCLENCN